MNGFQGLDPLLALPKATLQQKKCGVREDCCTFHTFSSSNLVTIGGFIVTKAERKRANGGANSVYCLWGQGPCQKYRTLGVVAKFSLAPEEDTFHHSLATLAHPGLLSEAARLVDAGIVQF